MFEGSFPLGPFMVEMGGKLMLRALEPAPAFSFRWQGTSFTVKMTAGNLALKAAAGRIPSTVDGHDRREEALTLLRAFPPAMPRGLRLRLLPDHCIQLETEADLDWPTTAPGLLAPIVAMLMSVAPVLDLLKEAGLNER